MKRYFTLDFNPRTLFRSLLRFGVAGAGMLALCFLPAGNATAQVRFIPPVLNSRAEPRPAVPGDVTPLPSPTERPAAQGGPAFRHPAPLPPGLPPGTQPSGSAHSGDPIFSPMRIEPTLPSTRPENTTHSLFPADPSEAARTGSVIRPSEPFPPVDPSPRRTWRPIPLPSIGTVVPSTKPLPLPPAVDREELSVVLQHGLDLESEQRWGDALTHYDTALRIYHNDEQLAERYRVARFHFDVGRRAGDSSYRQIIHSTNQVDALALYEKIISRIQNDYVDMPHWDHLFRYALQDVEIALSDVNYRRQANVKASKRQLADFLEEMQRTAQGWEIRNRDDLKNGILGLAVTAQKRLDLNPVVFLMECTCAIANSLDPYSGYLTPNKLNEQYSMISGNLVGLGVEVRSDSESLRIVRVIEGSPAQESGLHDGDRILTINGVSTRGKDTDSAADLLQGEEGTEIRLTVRSQNERASRPVSVIRRRFDVPSVEDVHMVNSYLGYVKLTGFQSKTGQELKRALLDLDRRGMRCLVLDLRGNSGGLLQVGIEVANMFLDGGPIVRTKGRNSTTDMPYMATADNTWTMPLIVLIDEESASASEIVAGAIRDHRRGTIIGKRSFGKGTIQVILSVDGGQPGLPPAGLRLTVEKFFSPNNWPYSGVGVAPDIPIETEKRVTLARPINGRLEIPVHSRTVSSDANDPFMRQAIVTAGEMLTETAM